MSAWQLVPVEPTEEMLDAYWHQAGESKEMRSRTHHSARQYFAKMLAAAPSPPPAEGIVAELRGPVASAVSRLIAGAFRRDGERLDDKRPRFSIPARPDEDDDLVVSAAIHRAADEIERLQTSAEAAEAREAKLREALKQIASHDNHGLTDGSFPSRVCLDWMVSTASAALKEPSDAE